MILSSDVQSKYNDLYLQLRNYIWDFKAVQAIANLEIAVYKAIPEMNAIRKAFNNLVYQVKPVSDTDEDVEKAMNSFKKLIESDDEICKKLPRVQEVM